MKMHGPKTKILFRNLSQVAEKIMKPVRTVDVSVKIETAISRKEVRKTNFSDEYVTKTVLKLGW